MRKYLVPAMVFLALVACAKEKAKLQIAGWEKYEDMYTHTSFTFPKDWTAVQEGTRISVYSSPEAVNRFVALQGEGADAVRLVVASQKLDSLETIEHFMTRLRNDMIASGYDASSIGDATLAGMPGKSFEYSGHLDAKNRHSVIRVSAVRDSLLYTASFEGFNELFHDGKAVFDTLLASLRLPEPTAKTSAEEEVAPSTTFTNFENKFLKISYPDNFQVSTPTPKAPYEFSMDIRGYRQDSYVHLDIMPAKGLTPDKVVEQNAKFYKGASRGAAIIDGASTTFLNYTPMKDIKSRVYFLVKNDKIYRVIFNYYAPMEDKYLPAFEQAIATLELK
jgi:hypothetical protein